MGNAIKLLKIKQWRKSMTSPVFPRLLLGLFSLRLSTLPISTSSVSSVFTSPTSSTVMFSCRKCRQQFSSNNRLHQHIRAIHPSQKTAPPTIRVLLPPNTPAPTASTASTSSMTPPASIISPTLPSPTSHTPYHAVSYLSTNGNSAPELPILAPRCPLWYRGLARHQLGE